MNKTYNIEDDNFIRTQLEAEIEDDNFIRNQLEAEIEAEIKAEETLGLIDHSVEDIFDNLSLSIRNNHNELIRKISDVTKLYVLKSKSDSLLAREQIKIEAEVKELDELIRNPKDDEMEANLEALNNFMTKLKEENNKQEDFENFINIIFNDGLDPQPHNSFIIINKRPNEVAKISEIQDELKSNDSGQNIHDKLKSNSEQNMDDELEQNNSEQNIHDELEPNSEQNINDKLKSNSEQNMDDELEPNNSEQNMHNELRSNDSEQNIQIKLQSDEHVIKRKEKDDGDEIEEDNILNNVTTSYVHMMVKSYEDALISINRLQLLHQWIKLNFQGKNSSNLQNIINKEESLSAAKKVIIKYIRDELIIEAKKRGTLAEKLLTPWDFAISRNEMLINLFGLPSNTIPVTVIVGNNKYMHMLSQDFTFGLLAILNNNPQYQFLINDIPLTFLDLKDRYLYKEKCAYKYRATLFSGDFIFNSADVIQGAITAAKWSNLNPHTLIKNFVGIYNGKLVPLKF